MDKREQKKYKTTTKKNQTGEDNEHEGTVALKDQSCGSTASCLGIV